MDDPSRCLCMLSDSDKAACLPPYSSTYRLLYFSDMLRAVLCLPGTGSVALCGMIHKVLYLFGAKSVNGAQKRTDCVCRASVKCRGEMLLLGSSISRPLNMCRGRREEFPLSKMLTY